MVAALTVGGYSLVKLISTVDLTGLGVISDDFADSKSRIGVGTSATGWPYPFH